MRLAKPIPSIVRGAAGHASIAVIEGVCIVNYSGTMTLSLYVEVCYSSAKLIDAFGADACFFAIDHAIVGMSEDGLRMAAEMIGPAANQRLAIPGAMVVSEASILSAKRHCWRQTQRGVERKAFTERAPAWAWAVRRAREAEDLRLESQARGFLPSERLAL